MPKQISKIILMAFLILSVSGLMSFPSEAAGNLKWHKNTDALTVNLNAVCFENNRFVAVGEDGMIKTSQDGYQWTVRASGTNNVLTGVIWGNDQFLAIGFSGTILSSADGISWAVQKSGTANALFDVIWDGSKYIAVGVKGTIITSSDGVHWKQSSPFTADPLFGITCREGQYVVVGENNLIRSADGINWSPAEFKKQYKFVAIDCNSSIFVVTGLRYEEGEKRTCVLTSKNGVNWSAYELPSSGDLTGIAYDQNKFVLVGTNMSAVSGDGSDWSFLVNESTLNDVVFAKDNYVAVGTNGTIEVSENGQNWAPVLASTQCDFQKVIWGGHSFLGVGGNGNGTVLTSPNGQGWVRSDVESSFLSGAIWNGKQYVLVGVSGCVLTSSDGVQWESSIIADKPYLKSIAWDGRQYAAVGYKGTIYTSSDGFNWVERESGTEDTLNGIAWSGDLFVAVGGNTNEKIILTSEDGLAWTTTFLVKENSKDFRGVIWANRQFLAFGSGGFLISSKNGTVWSPAFSNTTFGINDIIWDGSQYYYVGDSGIMGSSNDGINWTPENSGTTLTLRTISWNGETLAAAGYASIALTAVPSNMIKVQVDKAPVIFDIAPITMEGRTLVSLRAIFEALGAEITWDDQTRTVTAIKDNLHIVLKVGSSTALINGKETALDVPAVNYNDRIMVPTRFIAESFGADVYWDSKTRTVIIEIK